MISTERPGVYTSYQVESMVAGAGRGGAVGLAAAAGSGGDGQVRVLTSYAQALAAFKGGDLPALARLLLENGAPAVYACAVEDGDYEAAFAALMGVPEIKFMVCDSREDTVHQAMKSAIEGGDEAFKYRVGIVESGETERDGLIAAAGELNCERMLLLSHHETEGVPGSVACALCGLLAGEEDPARPVNGAKLKGTGGVGANFSDGDIGLLVRGGVTALETVSGRLRVIRGVTTRTSTGGAPDSTWRELGTVLIVDRVIPGIRDALRGAFARSKNTAQTRGAIRTRVIIELEEYLKKEIIDGYGTVTAEAAEDDPTVCLVSFAFTVAHGLNRIELSAHITV